MTNQVRYFTITEHHAGQRIDNFLVAHLKGVPKSHIYQMVRSGAVRVNKKRVDPKDKLALHDLIRVPPVKTLEQRAVVVDKQTEKLLRQAIIHEDEKMIVLNKPAGIAVHSGSGQKIGVIEAFRVIRQDPHLDLAHRIDKETSGILVIAKTRPFLKEFHELFRDHKVKKTYIAVLSGKIGLKRHVERSEVDGKESETLFIQKDGFVEAYPKSGRTHQIRVHAAFMGCPILGDTKYGGPKASRLYLHASELAFTLASGEVFAFKAEAPEGFF